MENTNPPTSEEIQALEKKRDEVVRNAEKVMRDSAQFFIEHAKGQFERGIISKKQCDAEVDRQLDQLNQLNS